VTESALLQLCVLRVGAEEYVVDLARVDEVLRVPPVTPLPRAPAFLEGVVNLRGEMLPVVDVRRRLGVPKGQGQAFSPGGKPRNLERLVVCRIGRRRVGLIVDAATHVVKVTRNDLRPAPLASGPGRAPYVLGVCGGAGSLKLLLDVKALVAEEGP
jgi:purine-binding chemotaxis protein CheW